MKRVLFFVSMTCSVVHAMWFLTGKKDQTQAQNTSTPIDTVTYFQPVMYKNNENTEYFIGHHTIVDASQDRMFWLYDRNGNPMMCVAINKVNGRRSVTHCSHNFTWMNGHYGLAWEKSGILSLTPEDIFAHKDEPFYIGH